MGTPRPKRRRTPKTGASSATRRITLFPLWTLSRGTSLAGQCLKWTTPVRRPTDRRWASSPRQSVPPCSTWPNQRKARCGPSPGRAVHRRHVFLPPPPHHSLAAYGQTPPHPTHLPPTTPPPLTPSSGTHTNIFSLHIDALASSALPDARIGWPFRAVVSPTDSASLPCIPSLHRELCSCPSSQFFSEIHKTRKKKK